LNPGNEPYSFILYVLTGIIVKPISFGVLVAVFSMFFLLVLTAMVSAAEAAFFSLTPSDIDQLKKSASRTDQKIIQAIGYPKRLLATLLISINFLNIAIVLISTIIISSSFDFSSNPTVGFIIQVVVVAFLILLIGEVIPKIYATQNAKVTSRIMIFPVVFLQKLFLPLSSFLIFSTSLIDKRVKRKRHNISVDQLSHALDLTGNQELHKEDQKILKGIVRFGNIDVKQIMKSRMDVVAFEQNTNFKELLSKILSSGFSRIPIYKKTFDNVIGVLYIKDLLPHFEKESFDWLPLVRPPFFVPESKKIDDLLKDFQHKKIHLALVVDEYGGTSGIVTLEDVIEEIIGEINDEFDDDDLVYSRLDENNFVFEGKILLNDLYRIMEIDGKDFEEIKGEADTLAGFLIELEGKIPHKNEKIVFRNLNFIIEAVDNRKIRRVKVSVNRERIKA
jgi:putative hemolysin